MGIGLGAASGVGPFTLAALADRVGVHAAFLIVPACCLLAAACITAAGRGPTAQPPGCAT